MFNQFKKIITSTSLAAFIAASLAPSVVMAQGTVTCDVMQARSVSAKDLFDFDKSTLSANGKKVLQDYAASLKNMKSISTVTLVGHTDGMGSVAYNNALGQRRADAVKAYLVSQGISPNVIQASSKGKSELLNNELTADGKDDPVKRQANRRVDVTTTGQALVAGTNCPAPAVAAAPKAAAVAGVAAAGVVAAGSGGNAASEAASGGLSNAAIVGGVVVVGAAIAIGLSGGDSGGSSGTTGTTGTR
jgi:outer membrane protein OmpA-like peptidoglycan-associated protein